MSEFRKLQALAGVGHTPAYVLNEEKLLQNLEILKSVQERTDCKILLAQKAFSMFKVYPLISKYLAGTTASGLYEAKLGRKNFKVKCMYFHRLTEWKISMKLLKFLTISYLIL